MRQGSRWSAAYLGAYVAALLLGRLMSAGPESLAVVAPAVGVGAMWVLRERRVSGAAQVVGVAVALGLLLRLATGMPPGEALVRTASEAAAAVAGALVLRRLPRPRVLDGLGAAGVLGAASVAAGVAAAAVLYPLSFVPGGPSLGENAGADVLLVAVRDALGLALVGALVMAWPTRTAPVIRVRPGTDDLLAVVVWAGVFALVHPDLLFLTLPVTLGVALRLGVLRTAAHVVTVAGATVAMTWLGLGPFAGVRSVATLALVETYLTVLAAVALATAPLLAEQQRDRGAAEAATDELRRIVDTALVAQMTLVVHGDTPVVVQANPAAATLFRCTQQDLLYRSWFSLVDRQHREQVTEALAGLSAGAPYWSGELRHVCADGQARWTQASVARMAPGAPEERRFTVQLLDVTDRLAFEQELAHEALHDLLTGCANRALLADRMQMALTTARRADRPVAVLFLDLDLFKEVNDTFGHAAGDVVLATVAHRLLRASRDVDTVARLGGDEFVVCAPDVDGEPEAEALARRLAAVVGEPIPVAGQLLETTVSVGVTLSGAASTVDGLLAEADAAMYEAKRRGRGRVEVHGAGSASRQRGAER